MYLKVFRCRFNSFNQRVHHILINYEHNSVHANSCQVKVVNSRIPHTTGNQKTAIAGMISIGHDTVKRLFVSSTLLDQGFRD